ncbi:hypothetical protein ACQKML_08110 [Peribacillus frigoritolerans]
MEFNKGDKVEHKSRGKGTFIEYDTFENESVVQFEEGDAEGDTLTVSTSLLKFLYSRFDYVLFKGYMDEMYNGNDIDNFKGYYENLLKLFKDRNLSMEQVDEMKKIYDKGRHQKGAV